METLLVKMAKEISEELELPIFYSETNDYKGGIPIHEKGEGWCRNSLATCYGIYLTEFQGTRRVNGIGGIFRDIPITYFEVWINQDEDIVELLSTSSIFEQAFLDFHKQHLLRVLEVNKEARKEHQRDSRD